MNISYLQSLTTKQLEELRMNLKRKYESDINNIDLELKKRE